MTLYYVCSLVFKHHTVKINKNYALGIREERKYKIVCAGIDGWSNVHNEPIAVSYTHLDVYKRQQ